MLNSHTTLTAAHRCRLFPTLWKVLTMLFYGNSKVSFSSQSCQLETHPHIRVAKTQGTLSIPFWICTRNTLNGLSRFPWAMVPNHSRNTWAWNRWSKSGCWGWDLVTFQSTESQQETVIQDWGFLMVCRGKLTTDPKRLSCCRIHIYKQTFCVASQPLLKA